MSKNQRVICDLSQTPAVYGGRVLFIVLFVLLTCIACGGAKKDERGRVQDLQRLTQLRGEPWTPEDLAEYDVRFDCDDVFADVLPGDYVEFSADPCVKIGVIGVYEPYPTRFFPALFREDVFHFVNPPASVISEIAWSSTLGRYVLRLGVANNTPPGEIRVQYSYPILNRIATEFFGITWGGETTGYYIINVMRHVNARRLDVIGPGGTITAQRTGESNIFLNCSNSSVDCGANLARDNLYTLTAIPDPGFRFVGWEDQGGCRPHPDANTPMDVNPLNLRLETDTRCKALFEVDQQRHYALSLNLQGRGSVLLAPSTSLCDAGQGLLPPLGTFCINGIPQNDTATLIAVPASGWSVNAWSGDCVGGGDRVELTMDGDKRCNVIFLENENTPRTLSVGITGNGAVTSEPAGIACPERQCTQTYAPNEQVVLTATAGLGSNFLRWEGDCMTEIAEPSMMLTMDRSKTCTAVFEEDCSIIPAPSANFSTDFPFRRSAIHPGQENVFDASTSTGDILYWEWDFPSVVGRDVQTTAFPTIDYRFPFFSGGGYVLVNLTVHDRCGRTARFSREIWAVHESCLALPSPWPAGCTPP